LLNRKDFKVLTVKRTELTCTKKLADIAHQTSISRTNNDARILKYCFGFNYLRKDS